MIENKPPKENLNSSNPAAQSTHAAARFGTVIEVVARYTRCQKCGSHLHFTHVTDFVKNLTQETARCPECNTDSRQSMHRLQ